MQLEVDASIELHGAVVAASEHFAQIGISSPSVPSTRCAAVRLNGFVIIIPTLNLAPDPGGVVLENLAATGVYAVGAWTDLVN